MLERQFPKLLCISARSGNTGLSQLLIRHGADVDYNSSIGTPLENAVTGGDLELVRTLIAAKADIQCQGIKGTLLTRAVADNRLEIARELISAGVNVNAQPKAGSPALIKAVGDGRHDFVRLLLEAGADVNLKGSIVVGEFGTPTVPKRAESGPRTFRILRWPMIRHR